MPAIRSKLRRSAVSAGPVLIAILMGLVLVVSSALSYRDASNATDAYQRNRVRRVLLAHPAVASDLLSLARDCRTLRDWTMRAAGTLSAESGTSAASWPSRACRG